MLSSPQLQQITDTMEMMNNDVISAIQSNAMKAVIDLGNRVAELVSSVDFPSMLKNLVKL